MAAVILITAPLYPVHPARAQSSVIPTAQALRASICSITVKTADGYRQGAGVIVRSDGLLVTNLHTVAGAPFITVKSANFGPKTAKVAGLYAEYDLVLLKIAPQAPLTPIRLFSETGPLLGQSAYHVGSSFLLDGTISEGRITGLGTSKQAKARGEGNVDIIRLDIRLFKGDSGGPIFNRSGELLGIVVAKDLQREGVTFAVPVNKIKKILSDI